MAKGYVIHVGHYAPERVVIATPDKFGRPIEDTIIESHKTNANTLIMNRAQVFAKRVGVDGKMVKNKEGVEEVLEVSDPRYRGELEFLKWGDRSIGAQAIQVMYLSNSNSLDYEYQRTVQKLEPTQEQAQLTLSSGENKFDPNKEALLIQLLKVHPQNRDSVSKNPNPSIKGHTFHEVTDAQTDKAYVIAKEASLTAGLFVKSISAKPQQLRNLLEIFKGYGVDFGEINDLSNETDIYSALLRFADQPGEFGLQVNRYLKDLEDAFDKAESYKVLDLTKNGYIAFLKNNKPEVIWENAEGKGNAMREWVAQNYYEDYVYKQSQYFMSLVSKLQ